MPSLGYKPGEDHLYLVGMFVMKIPTGWQMSELINTHYLSGILFKFFTLNQPQKVL
jgi:hypothetical protein